MLSISVKEISRRSSHIFYGNEGQGLEHPGPHLEDGHGILHPLYQSQARAEGRHAKGARVQAPAAGAAVAPHQAVREPHHLHQPLLHAHVVPALRNPLNAGVRVPNFST